MKRRIFLKQLGIGSAAAVIAPHVLATQAKELPAVSEHPKFYLDLTPIHDNVVFDKEFYNAFLLGHEFNKNANFCVSDSERLHVQWTTKYDKNYNMFTTDCEGIRAGDWITLYNDGDPFIYCRVTKVLHRHDLPNDVKLYMSKWEVDTEARKAIRSGGWQSIIDANGQSKESVYDAVKQYFR